MNASEIVISVADEISRGMNSFLMNYLKLTSGERLLVIYSDDLGNPKGQACLDALVDTATRANIDIQCIPPQSSFNPSVFANQDVVLYATNTRSDHKSEIVEILESTSPPTCRFYRFFSFSIEAFKECFNMAREQISQLNEAIINNAQQAKKIHVKSSRGTDLTIDLQRQMKWISSFGYFDRKLPGLFPPGEVNTCSTSVNGVLVADGAYNSSFPFLEDPRLEKTPVRLQIEHGKVSASSCEDPLISLAIERVLAIENGNRVAEIGFGTNESVTQFVNFRSFINERFPGFHIGLGATVGAQPVDWKCPVHLDLILSDCDIYFDEQLVFTKQKWIKSAFSDNLEKISPHLFADAI